MNLTPVPALTLSLEMTNILRNTDKIIYTAYPEIPLGSRQAARTVQASVRFRF
jgi:hypothetical protein